MSQISFVQSVRNWCESKSIDVEIGSKSFQASKDGQVILSKFAKNSWFRSSAIQSFVNQLCKKLEIVNDFNLLKK